MSDPQYPPQKFLFKCEECEMIISVELEEEQDIRDVNDNKMTLKCQPPCEGQMKILRD